MIFVFLTVKKLLLNLFCDFIIDLLILLIKFNILLLKNQSAIIQFPESTLTSAVFKISSLSTKGKLFQINADLTTGAEITTVNTAVSNADRKVLFVPTTGESGNDYSEFSFTKYEI